MDKLFKCIAMVIVGPLNRSAIGHKFSLVVFGYGTKYPGAYPFKSIDSEIVANVMIETFSSVGIPGEILTDQGANFMSSLISQLCTLWGIKKINTSPYHL